MSGVGMGEPGMLADAKTMMRAVLAEHADMESCSLLLVEKLDDVLGKLFADTAEILATPPVRRDLVESPPERTTTSDEVVIALCDALAKQSETIAAQADEIVSLATLVRAPRP